MPDAATDGAATDGVLTDEKGVIQIFNVGAERMLGYTGAEVVNKNREIRWPKY
jgi:PAS domain S-box-containing protein